MDQQVPEEFTELEPYGPFSELVTTLYGCMRDGIPVVGIRAETKHSNRSGNLMHGGMMATLADMALLWGLRRLDPDYRPCMTTSMSVDFIGPIAAGDWVEAHVNFIKLGRTLNFAECLIYANDKVVGRANAQFMVYSK